MAFENLDYNDDADTDDASPPEESSNRMFLVIAGILGGIAVLVLVCIAIYALAILPKNNAAIQTQRAAVDAQNTEVFLVVGKTSTSAALAAIQAAYTATPTITPIPDTATPTPTRTQVVAAPTTALPAPVSPMPDMATATALHATLTHNAVLFAATATHKAAMAATPIMPTSGFADEVGLPMLFGFALLLIVVIFLARRLRTAG